MIQIEEGKEIERKNIIADYINFAIKNGYKTLSTAHFIVNSQFMTEVVTSKEFIEAIARGIYKLDLRKEVHGMDTLITINHEQILESDIIQYITIKQAIAIRDNNLPEFITNILGLGTE